jgi:hypothetical protein
MKKLLFVLAILFSTIKGTAQVDESQTGAWYMYFFNKQFKDSQWGIQGDFQYRDWAGLGDMEQLLLRSGLTFKPKDANVMFTLGYANITSGVPGEISDTSAENRIYQEALIPQKLGSRYFLTHRFRYEQRFVEDQDFRTRYRYMLFFNVPFNKTELEKDAIYLALYNELFINGQTDIGDGRTTELFDRNRTYLGLGYVLSSKIRIQLGWMNQKTVNWGKGQLQFSLHHTL